MGGTLFAIDCRNSLSAHPDSSSQVRCPHDPRPILPLICSDRAALFECIRKGAYTYDTAEVPTPCARDLISRLLKLEPMERYSTRETLHHPYLTASDGAYEEATPHSNLDTVHEMMRQFNAERRLKRAVLVVLACGRFRRATLQSLSAPAG